MTAVRSNAAGKAVWRRAILIALFLMLLLPATSTEASSSQSENVKSQSAAGQAASLVARRHADFDVQLNDAVENRGLDNIVWGNSGDDNIVWGNRADDNIVWANNGGDNIVWGNSVTQAVQQLVFGDEPDELNSLPSSIWDALFPFDANWTAQTSAVVTATLQPLSLRKKSGR